MSGADIMDGVDVMIRHVIERLTTEFAPHALLTEVAEDLTTNLAACFVAEFAADMVAKFGQPEWVEELVAYVANEVTTQLAAFWTLNSLQQPSRLN